MEDNRPAENGGNEPAASENQSTEAPSLSLPKGGGAIRGMGEKFSVNPVSGTGVFKVPVFTSPGRSDFSPKLFLSYDSGAGNGPFGFGWHLSVSSITRKTDKGLPRYFDGEDSDVFILSDAEDLVPALARDSGEGGQWIREAYSATLDRQVFTVQRYRPRVEGLFARIERWVNQATGDTFWKSVSKDNITSLYGVDLTSRISDPEDPSRIYTWLLASSHDDRGNAAWYEYKPEDSSNVPSGPQEDNRQVGANRYLKRIFYGNRAPYSPDIAPDPANGWCFEVVFDYGEHEQTNLTPAETRLWPCRPDPFSSYRSGFEVRSYRLCRRVLMFHHFPRELGASDTLVRSTDLSYSVDREAPSPLNPIYAFLESITQTGYIESTDGKGYVSKSLPPLEFAYTQAEIDQTILFPEPAGLENLPSGVDGSHYQWIDLDGEGSPGILSEQAEAWFYKRNLSALPGADGVASARFESTELVRAKPLSSDLRGGRQQLMDLAGDGRLSLVQFSRPAAGFYERDDHGHWRSFRPFALSPNLDWRNPNLRTLDLNGDGFADILITEDEVFTWHPSRAREGFGPAQTVRKPFDEDRGPALIFADGTQSLYTADMSGDGLADIVRIKNGEVCYWPNLGYGRFGPKITMAASPVFAPPDLFDQKRVRLADIDGSGTTDIIYLGLEKITFWFNRSGNGWSSANHLPQFPSTDDLDSVDLVDLRGNGTSCLVWSSPLAGEADRPMRYIDLMGGQKPHLLTNIRNNLGAETRVHYAASTKFYLADRLAGRPWATRLSFPVQVVERVETYDWISRNRFVTTYAYHHGYYDGIEREFRGFGMVEQRDAEEIGALSRAGDFPDATNVDAASYVPPVLTKTWFHTGAYPMGGRVSRIFAREYYRESDGAGGATGLSDAEFEVMSLPDSVLPAGLSGAEVREAIRSLKGSLLRQEIYALDGTAEAGRPYSVSEKNYTVTFLQPFGGNRHAVFFAHSRESVDFHYERKLYPSGGRELADPRVTHNLVLGVDDYGNELQSLAIGYGRRRNPPDTLLTQTDRASQSAIRLTWTESSYTNPILASGAYRIPLPAETRSYELINVTPDGNLPDVTNLFTFDELADLPGKPGKVGQAGDGSHDLPFEDLHAAGATDPDHPYRRLIGVMRTLYRKDDLTALLPLGVLEPMGLTGVHYKLAFTPGLLTGVYRRTLPDQPAENLLPNPAAILGGGGYVQGDDLQSSGLFPASDASGCWWIPSGRIFYSPGPADTPAAESAGAAAHFFLPRRFEDPFHQSTTVVYDEDDLLALDTQDALGNRVTAGARDSGGNVISNGYDYRVLQPRLITDSNGNQSAVAFDILGLVVANALMGKPGEAIGDRLTGFAPDLDQADLDLFLSSPDPHSMAPAFLGQATTRVVYDLDRFLQTSSANPGDPAKWKPVFAATLARETHASDPTGQDQTVKIQISFGYSDGFGREIQKKTQTEPGPVGDNGPPADPRWVGSGWTIFNNKGKPVRKFEPFFSGTFDFEYGLASGVSSILFYDPVGRIVASLHPDQSWEKIVFDPWRQESWDGNDTVLIPDSSSPDPSLDADVGVYFQRLPRTDYFPTWYAQRISGGLGTDDQDAAVKTAAHANTPTVVHFDTLGRIFLSVADNGFDQNNAAQKYATRTELDIQGFQRSITDALDRKAITNDFDLLGTKLHQASIDAGERWMLNDSLGKPLLLWNSRGFQLQRDYDPLRRPIHLYLSQSGSSGRPQLAERVVYGEAHPDSNPASSGAPALLSFNLRGRVFQQYDGAGVVTNRGYDFKGNPLGNDRRLLTDYQGQADWSGLENLLAAAQPSTLDLAGIDQALTTLLEPGAFTTATAYDALNRPIRLATPDGSVAIPAYNQEGLLQAVNATLAGSAVSTPFVTGIAYNARGQRESIAYGNGAGTLYEYDPQTFRLAHLFTGRPGASFPGDDPNPPNPPRGVQNLRYTYDPVGNISRISDAAQPTVFFSNQAVAPDNDYAYDAVYRLVAALGREHIGQVGQPQTAWDDSPRMNQPVPNPNDGPAMRNYRETYQYDPIGNFQKLVHGAVNGNWTRSYAYDEPNPIPTNNHLTSTAVGGAVDQYGSPDAAGNMSRMPQLSAMAWDFKDQLRMTQLQAVNDGPARTTTYVYDSSGERVRKVNQNADGTKANERIYLGGYEVYREFSSAGAGPAAPALILERQTLHVMDDKRRIALVETRSLGRDKTPGQLIRFQFGNHLGSASLELDGSGAIISYEEYYPYGSTSYQAVTGAVSPAAKRYRYTGKERDEESGFYYHGARYYAPWLGRWISCDPDGPTDSICLYRYSNDPIQHRDPTGRAEVDGEEAQDRYGRDQDNFLGPLRRYFGFTKADQAESRALSGSSDNLGQTLYDAKEVRGKAAEGAGEAAAATGEALQLAQPAPEAEPDALSTSIIETVSEKLGSVARSVKGFVADLFARAPEEAAPALEESETLFRRMSFDEAEKTLSPGPGGGLQASTHDTQSWIATDSFYSHNFPAKTGQGKYDVIVQFDAGPGTSEWLREMGSSKAERGAENFGVHRENLKDFNARIKGTKIYSTQPSQTAYTAPNRDTVINKTKGYSSSVRGNKKYNNALTKVRLDPSGKVRLDASGQPQQRGLAVPKKKP